MLARTAVGVCINFRIFLKLQIDCSYFHFDIRFHSHLKLLLKSNTPQVKIWLNIQSCTIGVLTKISKNCKQIFTLLSVFIVFKIKSAKIFLLFLETRFECVFGFWMRLKCFPWFKVKILGVYKNGPRKFEIYSKK